MIYELGEHKDNTMDFAEAIDSSDLEAFGFTDAFIFELWGAITDAKSGRWWSNFSSLTSLFRIQINDALIHEMKSLCSSVTTEDRYKGTLSEWVKLQKLFNTFKNYRTTMGKKCFQILTLYFEDASIEWYNAYNETPLYF